MFAKRFFYVCAGLFLLALTYHLGARSATAQATGNPVVAVTYASGALCVMTAAGDLYATPNFGQIWYRYSNCFSGPTPVHDSTIGQLKARYR